MGKSSVARGSCLCRAIAFEIDRTGVPAVVGCYCANCRKVSGSQFGVYLQVRMGAFRWVSGRDAVETFESSPGNLRGRCRTCGCVAPIATSYGAVRVPAGALDEDPGFKPDVILFADDKANWCGLEAADQSFNDSGPPEFWRGVITRLLSPG